MAAAAEHGSAAIRPTLRAEAAMGAVIRSALARAGFDAAGATRLCFADEAAAPLVTTPDTAELQREDGLLVLPALYERCSGKEMPLGGLHEQDTSVPDFGRVKTSCGGELIIDAGRVSIVGDSQEAEAAEGTAREEQPHGIEPCR